MSRRRLAGLVVGATALLTVAAVALLLVDRARPPVDREHFEALRDGMSRAEVEAVLGGRPRDALRRPADVWVRGADGKVRSAGLAPGGPPVRFFPEGDPAGEAVWADDSGLIAVRFGADGRVADKHFSTVHPIEGPTFRGWVAHVLGRSRR
jgi:hypothetical protein